MDRRPPLPIDAVLPELRAAIAARGMAVLQAPPGAGKTTVVPLDLLAMGMPGRILLLEPRRLAARAAAERMAETLGEPVGQTVGYRIRGEAKVGPGTRIEVVTEGILTRMIQTDPDLPGVGCVIFDEFHERSLQADLGLALALEARGALRPDLVLIVMSATLEAGPVAALMGDAPVVTSQGRGFPVETRWLPRAVDASMRWEAALAGLILQALDEGPAGGLLAFLPGEGEIRRVARALEGRLPETCDVLPLFGAMEFAAQRAVLGPSAPGRRKVVLATAIAETSLTLPDITIVVDGGKARRARFDPGSGMSRLVTERVTRAEAEQRRGRAGRVAAGVCYRLWSKGEEGALSAFAPPEIMVADLAGLALELALWGTDAPPFLTPPPAAALTEAQALLAGLGALEGGRITAHGRAIAALPLHPRLAHMLVLAGPGARRQASDLAAMLSDRDPLVGAGADLTLRLRALADPRRFEAEHPGMIRRGAVERLREEAKRLFRGVSGGEDCGFGPAALAAFAYPDRIGLRRAGDAPRWLLSGGTGAFAEPGSALAAARLIVATDLDGDLREAKLRQGIMLTEAELRAVHGDAILWRESCIWSRREGRVLARRQECFGALVLDDRPWPEAPAEALAAAALEGVRLIGLPFTPAARRLRARMVLARGNDESWPDVSDAALLARGPDWLMPGLARVRSAADLRGLDLTEPLRGLLNWDQAQALERIAPPVFRTPLGRAVPIDYDGEAPAIAVRVQELFGVTRHPTVAAQPVRITLLSPGGHPLQVTTDLAGFWKTSYADVRRDMRGQYPRHPWPEDPSVAEPTVRAKPRGNGATDPASRGAVRRSP